MITSFILLVISVFFVFGVISFLLWFPKATYIIETLDDENSIEAKLRLAMLRYNEIVVIDLGSTDETLEIVKKMAKDYEGIRLVE